MALGTNKPFIVLNSGLVDLLDAEELRAVIGHELGHVLSGHAVYRTMLYNLIQLARGSPGCRSATSGCGPSSGAWRSGTASPSCPATGPACWPARTWTRPGGSLMKLAGGSRLAELNADAFHDQAREYDAVPDLRDSILKLLQLQGNTHPFAVVGSPSSTTGRQRRVRPHPGRGLPAPGHRPQRVGGRRGQGAARAYQESWNRSEDPLIGMHGPRRRRHIWPTDQLGMMTPASHLIH
jgi:hypothetical protein